MNRNFTAICAAFLMCAIMIVFYGSIALNKSSVTFAESYEQKTIYLTFDDGPSDRVTPKILDVLKEEDVKATFFIVGQSAETRKYLLRREIEEGHTVAVHTYSHKYSEIYSSPEKLIQDIEKCNEVIKGAIGRPAALYRFPGGSYGLSDRLINAVTNHGLRYVDWNASTRDAEFINPTADDLFRAAINTPANKDNIVLLAHDSTTKTATVGALEKIIKYYKNLGYTFAAF